MILVDFWYIMQDTIPKLTEVKKNLLQLLWRWPPDWLDKVTAKLEDGSKELCFTLPSIALILSWRDIETQNQGAFPLSLRIVPVGHNQGKDSTASYSTDI